MGLAPKLSDEERREAIVKAVRSVFVEKGFHETTTRELAEVAGVSETLLFEHFPGKEALYSAVQLFCFKEQGEKLATRLDTLKPSTQALVHLVHNFALHMIGEPSPGEYERSFIKLLLHSLTKDGEFARLAIQEVPSCWVCKAEECLRAAIASGEAIGGHVSPSLAAWFVNQMTAMIMFHMLPTKPVIYSNISREELIEQIVWFSLRGLGVKDEAIRRHYTPETVALTMRQVAASK